MKVRKTTFENCQLHETDFTETDLTGSVFALCDLKDAVFDNAILEKVDFRTAIHYTLDPDRNNIKKAKFSAAGVIGLLSKYDISIE